MPIYVRKVFQIVLFRLFVFLFIGNVDEVIVKKYPELSDLNPTAFKTQLDMFLQTTNATSMHEARLAFRGMSTEVRALFPHVLMLLRLLLVCPVT